MKKIIATLVLILSIIPNVRANQNSNTEFRATWVVTWEWINGNNSVEGNKALTRTILDNHKKANMNAVIWQARQSGTVYFESSYEPWGSHAGGKKPGYDALEYAIEQAHRRDMEFHAWFNVFHTASTSPGTPAGDHPEWVCRDQSGRAMTSSRAISPGLQDVRDYTIQVAMELVRNYDIDGLHLDYVRWNEYTSTALEKGLDKAIPEEQQLDGMITDEQLADLQLNQGSRYLYDVEHPYADGVPQGYSSWEQWWRGSVTEFVKTLHDSIQTVKPWVRLSVAALGKYNWSGWQGYGTVYQDAALWFNEGYVDQLMPMHYHWTTASGFYDMLAGPSGDNSSINCWGHYIKPGVEAGRLFSTGPGSYQFDDKNVWSNHKSVVEKVRTINWNDGFQFFSYGSWLKRNYFAAAKSQLFPENAKIRASAFIDSTAPEPPRIVLTKLDSLVYRVSVYPATTGKKAERFIVYRTNADSNVNVNTAEIRRIKFTDDLFHHTDYITEREGGRYYYAVTAVDRFWNESPLSTIERTDVIPEQSIVPQPVTMAYVKSVDNGYKLEWEPVEPDEIQGYRLYGTSTADGWTLLMDEMQLSPDSTSAIVSPPANETGWVFTVRAVGLGPLKYESPDPDQYGSLAGRDERVLVVDAFDRTDGAWQQPAHPFTMRVSQALGQLKIAHDCCANEKFLDRTFDPNDYAAVIWLTGDETVDGKILETNEMSFLAHYLRNGGNLLMSGANIALALDANGTSQERKFINEYLFSSFVRDGNAGNGYLVEGDDGSIIPLTLTLDDGENGFDVAHPDVIDTTNGGQACLYYNTGGIAGVHYNGLIGGGTDIARVVTLGFPFETINESTDMSQFLEKVMDYFGIIKTVGVTEETKQPYQFQLAQNYPNPFNPQTTIQYSIKQKAYVTVRIFDVLGQEVRTLVEQPQSAGHYVAVWDGVNNNGSLVRSGIYFYQLNAGGKITAMRKMLLIR